MPRQTELKVWLESHSWGFGVMLTVGRKTELTGRWYISYSSATMMITK